MYLVSWYFCPRYRCLHGKVFHAGFAQGVQHLLLLVLCCRRQEALLLCRLPLLSQSKDTNITNECSTWWLNMSTSSCPIVIELMLDWEDFYDEVNVNAPVQETLLSRFYLQSSSFPFGFVQHRHTCRANGLISYWWYNTSSDVRYGKHRVKHTTINQHFKIIFQNQYCAAIYLIIFLFVDTEHYLWRVFYLPTLKVFVPVFIQIRMNDTQCADPSVHLHFFRSASVMLMLI